MKTTLKMTKNGLQTNYVWNYKKYFRARSYGWRGSSLAVKRIKQALNEICKINEKFPMLAAEGAIYLMSRFWPAFEHIDTSSGSLGYSVYSAMDKLLQIVINSPADLSTRQRWLDILWEILQSDGVDYVGGIAEYWGELSGYKDEASHRADKFLPLVKRAWANKHSIVHYDSACLSALFYAGRYDEVLELVDSELYPSWLIRKFAARVLALTDVYKAIAYAEETRPILNTNQLAIDCYCEDLLLAAGHIEEAYQRYAIAANRTNTYLSWFNKIKKKYSIIRKDEQILIDLLDKNVVVPGKWFATANRIKCYDIALDIIKDSPADPRTLNRAAEKHLKTNPNYSLEVVITSLDWIIKGIGYEITNTDVYYTLSLIKRAAKTIGKWEMVKTKLNEMVNKDEKHWCSEIILGYLKPDNTRQNDDNELPF